jgi:hypothetical protein
MISMPVGGWQAKTNRPPARRPGRRLALGELVESMGDRSYGLLIAAFALRSHAIGRALLPRHLGTNLPGSRLQDDGDRLDRARLPSPSWPGEVPAIHVAAAERDVAESRPTSERTCWDHACSTTWVGQARP